MPDLSTADQPQPRPVNANPPVAPAVERASPSARRRDSRAASMHRWRALLAAPALAALLLSSALAAGEAEVSALLASADRWRSGQSHMQMDTEVSTLRADGSVDKTRRYTVFAQGPRKSLVLMRSPAEAGQKLLMLGDDFWLLMPGSTRPIRITPSQKLMGDASTGDIATLSWADDYQGRLVADMQCDGRPCLHLSLSAARKASTYQRVELWIGKARHEPLRAELYVHSDKLAKEARFEFDRADAPTTVLAMVLHDQLSTHKATRIRYLSRQPKQVPEAWLNPMFLAQNPQLE